MSAPIGVYATCPPHPLPAGSAARLKQRVQPKIRTNSMKANICSIAFLALACFSITASAHTIPVARISYLLIQATPKSMGKPIPTAGGIVAIEHPARFLNWLQANTHETTLVSGALHLHNGRGEIKQLKPMVIRSPAPNISIGATHETTGLVFFAQAQPFDGKILTRAQMRYTWHIRDNRVKVKGHSVAFPISRMVLFGAAGLTRPGHKLLEYQFDGKDYFVLVLRPGV